MLHNTKIILDSILMFKKQSRWAWTECKKLELGEDYSKVKNIIITGMGGSALGAHFIQCVFDKYLARPFFINNEYSLPQWADHDTLVIASSYSGNTEETIAAMDDAKKRGAKIIAISTGGKLLKLAAEKNIPYLELHENYNPSKQPRYGLGYNIFGILGILKQTGLLDIDQKVLEENLLLLTEELSALNQQLDQKMLLSLAKNCKNKIPVVCASEFLAANAHILQNQLNESGKNFAIYFELPEMNHHLLEALTRPKKIQKKICFLFLESEFYNEKNKKRFTVTKQILQKLDIEYNTIMAVGETKLTQAMNIILAGSLLSLDLAELNKKDPLAVPFVEEFKNLIK